VPCGGSNPKGLYLWMAHNSSILAAHLFAGQLARPGNFVLLLVAGLVFDLGTDD